MNPATAIILAGSRGPGDAVARAAGVAHKALAEIAGRPMLAHVLDALESSDVVGSLHVVMDPGADLAAGGRDELARREAAGAFSRLAPAASPARSLAAALDSLPAGQGLDSRPVLVTTADHPLLTGAMVARFYEAARAVPIDAAAAVVPAARVADAVPGTRRTRLKFREGGVSGANLFALMTPQARAAVRFWQRLEADRKRPWRMARRLGPGVLAAYLIGGLSLEGAVARLGARAGARLATVPMADGRAAVDVDSAEDLALVRSLVAPTGPM